MMWGAPPTPEPRLKTFRGKKRIEGELIESMSWERKKTSPKATVCAP